ncbi:MAG: chemotaxis response regulator protein-glutamate methylesterase [Deltaproteobacteria bacterium]|nr:chemotaxis response regulator protein-glutamate methylesterase [Deltaproteobacteria bacterium]MBW1993744.1 chemotaxis response regulator protein-glutamate methylesterase [Deltaproteobacteria bacterium]MBW2152920.1 chemotaxis response regulator protein-glutamate methylesterase [Deltaproteobacteria bacterium]
MTTSNTLRVLVVDDTVVYRKIVSDLLSEVPDVEVVGSAHNGKIALAKIASLKPDLLTLDIEMPEMDGLETLKRMKAEVPDVGAIMLSSLTHQGSEMTLKALELGAFDFIPKPQDGTIKENIEAVKTVLIPMLRAYARHKEIRSILRGKALSDGDVQTITQSVKADTSSSVRAKEKADIVAIGVSTGGPNALAKMMPELPADVGVPILIVQHMPPVFTESLATSLNAKCKIEVREAKNGEPLKPNVALIAPGGRQMKVATGTDGKTRIVRVTDDPPENSCKPSVDYLFRSVAHQYLGRATGVIMTGMGSDGSLGLKLMKRNGANIIAQSEETCVVFGMPKGPIEDGIVDTIAPLNRIAEEICQTVRYGMRSDG